MTHQASDVASIQAKPTKYIRPSIIDKARTITHICTSGTLCTTSVAPEMEGFPFGSYVDFITDENGWPVLLISNQSLHTQNIQHSPDVSLFCQLPKQTATQASASLSRVTIMGHIERTPEEDLPALQMAFTLIHPYSEQLFNSPKFSLLRLKPAKIFFSGGFGVSATWVDVKEYESARADVLANEMPIVLAKVNLEKQGELLLLCKHFLGLQDVEVVRVQTIDRLGMDLRIKSGGDLTDEYRVGFRHAVNSAEEAKSEMVKLFQEAWEREQGCYYSDELPLVTKYAEDIIRKAHSSVGSGLKI
eukprot:gene13100-15102_t